MIKKNLENPDQGMQWIANTVKRTIVKNIRFLFYFQVLFSQVNVGKQTYNILSEGRYMLFLIEQENL